MMAAVSTMKASMPLQPGSTDTANPFLGFISTLP